MLSEIGERFSKVQLENWSGRRGSNPRPRPWQGRALPLSYTRIRRTSGWVAVGRATYAKTRPGLQQWGLRPLTIPEKPAGGTAKELWHRPHVWKPVSVRNILARDCRTAKSV